MPVLFFNDLRRPMRFQTKSSFETGVLHAAAGLELKFSAGGDEGTFQGYGAVFGNMDSHGDVIAPGAFAETLAERKAAGRRLPMHIMHGVYGGDGVPAGVWRNVEEDSKGLVVDGKISGMNTDAGRLLYERVKDGALGGLSIGYSLKKNGTSYGTKPGEPKRLLKAVNLHEISLVDEPSNAMARVTDVKLGSKAELEDWLQQGGLSRAAARKIAPAAWRALSGGEDADPDPRISSIITRMASLTAELKGVRS